MAGLNNPIKRRWVAKLLLAEKADIVCLQENHLTISEERYLCEVFKGMLYHAAAPTKTAARNYCLTSMDL